MRCIALLCLALLLPNAAIFASEGSHRTAAPNAASALGINLGELGYWSAEQPFLNIFKTTGISHDSPGGWFTHSDSTWDTGEQAYLRLDANGYPLSLQADSADPHTPQQFNSVGVVLLRNLAASGGGAGPPYPGGRYVVLYQGEGTLRYGFDATLVHSSAGRDLIEVAHPTAGGIDLRITATDPKHTGDYIRNIRVVRADEEPSLDRGAVFRPGFLSTLQSFKVVRGMQWLNIDGDGGLLTEWSGRPLLSDAGWSSGRGIPLEVLLQLCNALQSDCWLNMPHQASDRYISAAGTLAHAILVRGHTLYLEFSNEVWNSQFAQYRYATDRGRALWPRARVTAFEYNRSWYGMRTAQTCSLWRAAWGADASAVVCVLAAQAANPWTATQALDCPLWSGPGNAPCWRHHIDAVAIAPYFGGAVPPSWTSQPDGGLSRLFSAMTTQNAPGVPAGGWLGELARWERAYHDALARYGLPLLAYEGGQTFVGAPEHQNGSPVVNLYIAANRDPRMRSVYQRALADWKDNGGETFVLFSDIYTPSQYGEWGLLESSLDATLPPERSPPKWRAVQDFMTTHPCWWRGCGAPAGTQPAR